MGDELKLSGPVKKYFQDGVRCVCWCCACFHTYSDGQLTVTGARQSVHGAVEQLVIMEADVAGVGANHHGVFLRPQLQVARHFLLNNR